MAKGHLVVEERPMEPRVLNGCGMRVLGFVPLGGLSNLTTTPLKAKESKKQEDQDRHVQVVQGPSAWKRGRAQYAHGNYGSYYNYRHSDTDSTGDRRLAALCERFGKGFLKGKEVLDIGCNSGLVSISLALDFRSRRVVGVELDHGLVKAARAHLEATEHPRKGRGQVEFRAEDILTAPLRRPPEDLPERFDVVLCFSVTKWIHFAKGDLGIHNLFKRCFKRTRPGGYFVLEPQEWGSYKKKRHLTREIRQTVAGIQIRPEHFESYLEDLGFEPVDVIDPPDDLPKNFQRRLRIFRRPEEVAEAKPRKRKV